MGMGFLLGTCIISTAFHLSVLYPSDEVGDSSNSSNHVSESAFAHQQWQRREFVGCIIMSLSSCVYFVWVLMSPMQVKRFYARAGASSRQKIEDHAETGINDTDQAERSERIRDVLSQEMIPDEILDSVSFGRLRLRANQSGSNAEQIGLDDVATEL